MLYETPKDLLQLKINEALGAEEEDIISDLIKLSLMKRASRDVDCLIYTEIFNVLGVDKFTDLVSLVNGKTITLPTKEDFKDTIITVLCYYYHIVLDKDWEEVKKILGMPDLNTIKQGIHSAQYESYLKELVEKRLVNGKKEKE